MRRRCGVLDVRRGRSDRSSGSEPCNTAGLSRPSVRAGKRARACAHAYSCNRVHACSQFHACARAHLRTRAVYKCVYYRMLACAYACSRCLHRHPPVQAHVRAAVVDLRRAHCTRAQQCLLQKARLCNSCMPVWLCGTAASASTRHLTTPGRARACVRACAYPHA